ncbi:MAG TPA: hypothetical protein VF490_16110 [Chryseosolibacter sp.]
MNLFKKLKSFTVLAFFLAILSSASLTSCNRAAQGDDKESTEHPSGDKAGSEHPSDSTASDSTKTQ